MPEGQSYPRGPWWWRQNRPSFTVSSVLASVCRRTESHVHAPTLFVHPAPTCFHALAWPTLTHWRSSAAAGVKAFLVTFPLLLLTPSICSRFPDYCENHRTHYFNRAFSRGLFVYVDMLVKHCYYWGSAADSPVAVNALQVPFFILLGEASC